MLIGDSLAEYVFIRSVLLAIRLVAPASFLYLAVAAYTYTWPISPWIAILAGTEATFYLFVYLPRGYWLQARPTYKPRMTKAQRQTLFAKCRPLFHGISASFPLLRKGWFLPGDKTIRRQDVVDWILWAIFSVDGRNGEMENEWKEEVDEYVGVIEKLLKVKLPEGQGKHVKSMRVTLDTIKTVHRPFLWYSFICLADSLATLNLRYQGFSHYASPGFFQTFPPRPLLTVFSNPSSHADDILLPYWYRPHRSANKLPILFLHGVGVGLYLYLPFLKSLVAEDPDVGIIIVELLPISAHMTKDTIPTRPLLIKAINNILESLGIFRVVLAGHSFGTVVAAQIIRPAPADSFEFESDLQNYLSLQRKIAHVLLADCIPILLHLPPATYNFLYRPPQSASEWQLWFFASRDADTARTLHRALFWQETTLWKDDLRTFMKAEQGVRSVKLDAPGLHLHNTGDNSNFETKARNVTIVLAGRDQIIPAEVIRHYLTEDSCPAVEWRNPGWAWFEDADKLCAGCEREGDGCRGGDLEVLFYRNLGHGNVFETADRRRRLLDVLNRFVSDF